MEVSTKNADRYTFVAHIALAADELISYLATAKAELGRNMTVPGFRKGKAPQRMVDQNLSEATVRAEALEVALEDSFGKAVEQNGWDVRRTSNLKVEQNDAAGLRYAVTVAVWPAVKLADLSSITIARNAVSVSDTDVDEALDAIRNMRATFMEKAGPAAVGDRVEVDFDARVDEKPVEGGSSRNHPLVIGGKTFMPGFEEELVGLVAGASKEFTLTAPTDYYEPKLAGKVVQFSVTLRRVQTVLKPAADDAFAQALGTFTTLHQLKQSIRDGIREEKGAKEGQRLRLAILDAIVAASDVPASDDMVHEELDDMVQRFSQDLRQRGVELPMYLARIKKTEEQLRGDWQGEAQRQVRIRLVLRTVAREQKIALSPEEIETAVQTTIAELTRGGKVPAEQVDPDRIRSIIAERMLRDRTLEFLERTCAAKA